MTVEVAPFSGVLMPEADSKADVVEYSIDMTTQRAKAANYTVFQVPDELNDFLNGARSDEVDHITINVSESDASKKPRQLCIHLCSGHVITAPVVLSPSNSELAVMPILTQEQRHITPGPVTTASVRVNATVDIPPLAEPEPAAEEDSYSDEFQEVTVTRARSIRQFATTSLDDIKRVLIDVLRREGRPLNITQLQRESRAPEWQCNRVLPQIALHKGNGNWELRQALK